jgi:hypothetical protein
MRKRLAHLVSVCRRKCLKKPKFNLFVRFLQLVLRHRRAICNIRRCVSHDYSVFNGKVSRIFRPVDGFLLERQERSGKTKLKPQIRIRLFLTRTSCLLVEARFLLRLTTRMEDAGLHLLCHSASPNCYQRRSILYAFSHLPSRLWLIS